MLLHWIWLAHRAGVSNRLKVRLLQHFRDPEDIYFADGESYRHVEGLSAEALESLKDKDLSSAQKALDACRREKLHILTIQDAAYPSKLKNISDPPLVLYYKGRLPDFDGQPLIAVVGTRKASPYGLSSAKRMGYGIAQCGGVVVSGVATGIDGVAMAGAMSAGGTVIGVLGNGVDVVYPLSNRALFADTVRCGCLLSEFPPGTPPYKWNFPKRNRIISGLSCGVLVVEAPERSGALITARQAAEQGRDVFVVPGNIDVPTCAGSNALLRDGAMMATSGWDILSEYQAIYPEKLSRQDAPPMEIEEERTPAMVAQEPLLPRKEKRSRKKKEKIIIDNGGQSAYIDVEKSLPSLNDEERAIVEQLKQGHRLTDDVIAACGLPAGKALAVLTMLQVKGVVTRLPGNRLSLK